MGKVSEDPHQELRIRVAAAASGMTQEAANIRVMAMHGVSWSMRRRAIEQAFSSMKTFGGLLETWFEANEDGTVPPIVV